MFRFICWVMCAILSSSNLLLAESGRKVVLLTGASSGIGLATAKRLASSGYQVYATTRDPLQAKELQLASRENSSLIIKPLDVTKIKEIQNLVQDILIQEGGIFALVNNAGFGIFGAVEMHTDEEVARLFEVNFFGVVRLTNAVIPSMRIKGEGRVINLSSIAGVIPSGNMPIYSATKFALETVTAAYARDLSPWNIKVCLIQPGPVVTHFEKATQFGTRFENKINPYIDTLAERRELWKERMDGGQTAEDVALVILKTLADPNPHLWVQTHENVSDRMEKHYKDLTGTIRIPE